MVWLIIVACSGREEEREAIEEGVRVEMQQHAQEASAAREAIIVGDLEAARAAGRALASRLPVPDLPPEPQLPVKAAAEALGRAGSLEQAAQHFSTMSAGCGGCHVAQGVTPPLTPPDPPPEDEQFTSQMQRYHWAAERMWQGLVLPSEDAFAEARGMLRSIPTAGFRPQLNGVLSVDAETMDAAIHEQATRAGPDQAAHYGAMLLTCALCHLNNPASPAHDEE